MSTDQPPRFRFSPNAYDLGLFVADDGVCAACEQPRTLRYTASFYAVDRPGYLCPWCVADGTAARVFGGEFCDSETIEGFAADPGAARSTDATEVREVATRTPSYPSWQQEVWLAHCGRPCAFLGFVGAQDLPRYLGEPDFAADVDGGAGFPGETVRRYLSPGGDLAGYLFQCLTCHRHRLHVDAA